MESNSVVLRVSQSGTEYQIDPTTLRAIACDAVAMLAAADALLAEAAATFDQAASARGQSMAGLMYAMAGRSSEGARLLTEAIELQSATNASRDRAVSQLRLVQVLPQLGQAEAAVTLATSVVDQVRQQPELTALLDFALQHLGKAQFEARRFAEAETSLREALILRQQKGDAELLQSTALALATVLAQSKGRNGRTPD